MPLLLIPLLIAALILGAYRLYAEVAYRFGSVPGVGAVVLALAIIVAVVMGLIGRHRYYHGRTEAGRRLLDLSGEWGRLTLNAGEKRGRLVLGAQEARFIFADIEQVARQNEAMPVNGPPQESGATRRNVVVLLRLRHAAQPEWAIPMANDRQARRWVRILSLAAEQRL